MSKTNSTNRGSKAAGPRPYKVGVAFSGGGARGFAHIGALIALEEAGLKPDVVAGVSAGSVIAVLYGAGLKPLQIAEVFARAGVRDFTELNFGGGGLISIVKFMDFIMAAIAPKKNIEELVIPTYIGVSDLDNACPHAFHSGAIGPRMMASCSIPIVFPPVEIDGVHYVDGGVLRNHPAWIIRDKCDLLIGVNVSPMPPKKNKYRSIIGVALRTYNLMAKANQADDMALCDVSVSTPEIAKHAVFDLKNIKDLVVSGYKNTRKALIEAGLWNTDSKQQ